ncbi:MAG: Dabb family protein [Flavobacteriales bacterium]|nr:MAG: Dabb family protein [Flavobacteriales bacterium]
MKPIYLAITLFATLSSLTLISFNWKDSNHEKTHLTMQQDSVLRHVVLFQFKEGTSAEDLNEIEMAFKALPSKISEIKGFEWGMNNSPEGLNKGFTHCYFLTFHSEEDRAVYLPHPDHKAFGALLGPHLADVLVVDYWAGE